MLLRAKTCYTCPTPLRIMKNVREKIRVALDNIDDAISLLREAAREDKKIAALLEDTLYYLEEAGEALSNILEESEQKE